MDAVLNFALLSFASLFSVVDPLGVVPLFSVMTRGYTPAQARRTAVKAVITSSLALLVFALTGRLIFNLFSISVDSLRVAGGVIFFMLGYDMLQARIGRTKHADEEPQEYLSDIAITPLAIPMICGPGAIASVIVLMGDAPNLAAQAALLGVIGLVMALTLLLLLGAGRVMKTLGENGSRVLLRLMGLIVMAIAVEFFFGGLKPILRDIFMLSPGIPPG